MHSLHFLEKLIQITRSETDLRPPNVYAVGDEEILRQEDECTRMKSIIYMILLLLYILTFVSCQDDSENNIEDLPSNIEFLIGADLSYVNQIMDHDGIYSDKGIVASPYKIFKDHGADIVRLRLWHNPVWTKKVYGANEGQSYNDLKDVTRAIELVKAQGMSVLLDIHYSDTWADPGRQEIPTAWKDIKAIDVLKDSVYQYTSMVLKHLATLGLTPEFVQIGNETNCGMLYTNAPADFPACNVCEGNWRTMGSVVSSAILAIRDASQSSTIKTKIVLHVADPKNVEWWFDNMTAANGTGIHDFDIIGISYYPIWHTAVGVEQISDRINHFRDKFAKDVMILETAYPWTMDGADEYHNVFDTQMPLSGYPFTPDGQYNFMVKLTQEVRDGGGLGIIYWEPAWISSEMKDLWGTGSSWENCTFFDFDGNSIQGIDFMKHDYK